MNAVIDMDRRLPKDVIVFGGGMIGVCSAIHLLKRGWNVVLIDRKDPGTETSYGNAGIIQSEAVRPYAMPRDLKTLAKIALGRTNDVRYRFASLPHHAGALAQYWWHSAPDRHREISTHWSQLIASPTLEHDVLVREAGADNWVSREGYRTVYRERSKFEVAVKVAEADLRAYGAKYRILDPNSLENAEPAIKSGIFAGAIHWLDPWTVSNPGGLVSAYAELFRVARYCGAMLRRSLQRPWVGQLILPTGRLVQVLPSSLLGHGLAIFWKSLATAFRLSASADITCIIKPRHRSICRCLTRLWATSWQPMAQGLRITTGAELTSPHAAAVSAQLAIAEREIRKLLDLGTPIESEPWFGTRPCTPDMLPVLGNTPRHRTLWVNFGHGHQGFTLGPASGRMLAELLSGERPVVDPTRFIVDRF